MGLLIVFQVIELIRFVNRTNRELAKLFLAIKHADFSITFSHGRLGRSFKALEESFTEVINAYKNVKIEKEAQFHFLQMMVNHLQTGVISLENETNLTLINPAAERFLQVKGIRNWRIIRERNPSFTKELNVIGSNGRKLVEFKSNGETRTLSVEVTTQYILDTPYRLITLQDINSEMEQKEIEAWQKLIRILTHEIMNSVTPISSLTETMQSMLEDGKGNHKPINEISEEAITDILFSLKTIQKRSDRLLTFIDDYRKFARTPKPAPENTDIRELFETVHALMRRQLDLQGIRLNQRIDPGITYAWLDRTLIEQVLINLITNSVHALADSSDPKITLLAYQRENYTIIEVADNGKGIPEKELHDIFIPFFSTKKEGSGVGLSLSKQIMNLHEGKITVNSKVGKGTSFYLHFPVRKQ